MGLTAKLSKRTTVAGSLAAESGGGGEGWGMGFFLVFFPQEHNHKQHEFSSSPFKSTTINSFIKRTNSSHLLAKAQSTISICALLIFFTLLLFTLSTFEPNNTFFKSPNHFRRHLSQSHTQKSQSNSHALQRLGTLYSRGTKPMSDLVLCHVTESVTITELKSFLRAFHRSGLVSKSDLMFIFPSITTPEFADNVIWEENRLFLKLIDRYKTEFGNRSNVSDFPASFDVTQVLKSGKASEKGEREPIWGRKIKTSMNSNFSNGGGNELTRTSYGSVVGFGVGEVDPEDSLSGFFDHHVPMNLRRWASYPMILGRLRRNYKHVMLVDVKEVLLLGDPLARIRTRSPESVFLSSLYTKQSRHAKSVTPSLIIGGARGVRRLTAAMLTEIVRATTHNKKKSPVTESALLSRLAANEFVRKSIQIVASTESIPEASSLSGVTIGNKTVVRRGNSNLDIEFMKYICSFRIEASVYADCGKVQLS